MNIVAHLVLSLLIIMASVFIFYNKREKYAIILIIWAVLSLLRYATVDNVILSILGIVLALLFLAAATMFIISIFKQGKQKTNNMDNKV